MRDLPGTVASVCDACEDATAGLQAAIVFGSALDGDDPGDVDLALLWAPDVPPRDRWRRANRLAAELEHRLGGRLNVDVKDLRPLPLPLQHRVLRDGRAAWVGDRRALVRFGSETVPRALDFLPFHRRMLLAAARRAGSRP